MLIPPAPIHSPLDNDGKLHHAWEIWFEKVHQTIKSANREVTDDQGDSSITVPGTSRTYIFDTALTVERTITLPTTAPNGICVKVVRTSNATGAFNIVIKSGGTTIATITSAGYYAVVENSPNGWIRTQSGTV
jgi:hypothetical protein